MNGTYEIVGEYNGKQSYQRVPDNWFIWWDNIDSWYISTERGVPGAQHFKRNFPDIEGDYPAAPGATGTATVTEI